MKNPEYSKESIIFSLAKVSTIEKSRGIMISKREEIKELVEQPLVEACEILWDKNIKTLESSANQKDIEIGHVYIRIDFDSLSQENRKIAQQYGSSHDDLGLKVLEISIPVNESSSIDEISEKATEIAGTFQKQKAAWISPITLEETLSHYEQRYGDKYSEVVTQEKERLSQPGAWEKYCKEQGYYFDPETQMAYRSEEYYRKANEKINNE